MRLDMPSIETKRLLLRPLEEADACDMYAYLQVANVTRYLSFPPHPDVEFTLHTIQKVLLPYAEQQDFETLVILLKEEDKMIGHLRLHSLDEDKAKLSYILHANYWHKGYAQEAVSALMKLGFMHCGLHRIEAMYEVDHKASEGVLLSCGFQKEGVLRQYVKLSDDRYHDMAIAAILKEEYKGDEAE